MRWQPSRLVSTLKSSTRTPRTEGRIEKQEPLPVQRAPNPQRWHEEVKRCRDVLEFLFNGRPPIDAKRARSLSYPTAEYLTAVAPSIVRPSIECDQILIGLLDEHASNDPATLCVAVLACLYDLSLPKATQYLTSLLDLDIDRYLRCLIVAGQIKPGVISPEELQAATLLLLIVSGQARGLQEFGQLIQTLALHWSAMYLPFQTVHNSLAKSGFRSRLQSQIQTLLHQRQFMTAFGLVSWLQAVTDIPDNDNVLALLDAHFQWWPELALWRPNLDRINVWEHGKISNAQKEKLSDVFKLDGPDDVIQEQASLKLVAPHCYEHVKIEPESPEALERYLDLLSRACLVGPNSIDLFIQQCVGKVVPLDVLSMLEDAVQTGDDIHCRSLLEFARGLDSHPNLTHDVQTLIDSITSLTTLNISEKYQPLMDHLAHRICSTMQLAQHEFLEQLRTGSGDYMGMLVHELGMAILKSSRIHSRLPLEFLQKVKQFPQQKTLEAIFDDLQEDSESSASYNSRFKSYLASSLGGNDTTESGSVTLANIQEEIKFWKRPPDILRKDLAKKLGEIQGLDYALYTTCLHATFKEHDLYLTEMKGIIIPDDEQTGLKFAAYLAYRRGLHQLQNECWLFLMASLLKSQRPSFLPRMADSVSFMEWDKLVGDLERLLAPIQDQLPESGPGLTRERMLWWKTLSQNVPAVKFLLEMHGQQRSLRWLYFPASMDHIMPLLRVAAEGTSMSPMNSQIISYLRRNGSNAIEVCDCIRLVASASSLGRAVCERFLSREEVSRWTESELRVVFVAWGRHESMTTADRRALESIRLLLRLPLAAELRAGNIRSTNELLQSEYDILFQEARKLESLRLRLQHQNPERVSTILSQIGVENITSGRVVDERIPDDLVDAIDEIGENEYELSFALTALSNLQRQARGIHKDSRMLLVRLSLQGDPQFCIHFSPNDEGQDRHRYWRPLNSQEPATTSCTTKPTLFTYYLGRNLHHLLRNGQPSLASIYGSIQTLITAHPTTCLVCSNTIGTKLWKPSACSVKCSRKLRQAPLEVRLHNLLVDPAAVDLLLTCVYAAAADTSTLDLLPGCPVKKNRITAVIDSLPALASFQTASNLKSAIQGTDGFGKEREDLLSWLCLKFRGFILSAQSSFRVPSMPNTQQFLMLNSNHEREALFNAQAPTTGNGRVIFHGTQVSRLFLILTEGLKVMSNTPFMLTGAARGAGIYCGDDQGASFHYSGVTGPSWKNSTLGNMRVMLGCELASSGPSSLGNYHVVTDENSLLVRYVFLLPANYQSPPRHHVEPAMNITYANLRSGTLI
ncbi:hypothetical protein BDZ45DRAFT_200175 [Acephala macrosclerotiorum]|nr:hypothetical protein BDZ45DRAFT_200175 [Acephala macrosclerotiorum]